MDKGEKTGSAIRKRRALTVANVLDKKPRRVLVTGSEEINALLGKDVELSGLWIIYGAEKNGKTSFALQLAKAISQGGEKVLYVSAEEGYKGTFAAALRRSGLTRAERNIIIEAYMPVDELIATYKSRQKASVIFIDNVKAYEAEFRANRGLIGRLKSELSHKLLIFLAHKKDNKPYPSQAIDIKLFADVVAHVEGLVAEVVSRYENGGGEYVVSDTAERYYGRLAVKEINEFKEIKI